MCTVRINAPCAGAVSVNTKSIFPHLSHPGKTKLKLGHDLLLCARLRVFLHDEIARQYVLTVTQRMHDDRLIPACYQLIVLIFPRGWETVEEIAFGGR